MENNKALLLCLLLIPSLVSAHGGRADKFGCHNDRKNGGYHCHNGGTSSQSPRASTNVINTNFTKTNLAKPQSFATQPNSQIRETNIAAHKDLVLKIQSALNQLGYSVGNPEGVLGKQTIKAIKHFQVDYEISVDGKPTFMLLSVLLEKEGS